MPINQQHCVLQGSSAEKHTWHECFGCEFSDRDGPGCEGVDTDFEDDSAIGAPLCGVDLTAGASRAVFEAITRSSYAAQLAWWLQFYSPERFLFVAAPELQDTAKLPEVRVCWQRSLSHTLLSKLL